MSEMPYDQLESRLRRAAGEFRYPPTPDLAASVAKRLSAVPARRPIPRLRLAWALVLVLFGGLLSVPQVRAAIAEFLQIGAVRIFLVAPTATPVRVTATPAPTPLASWLDLSGETTLEAARARTSLEIRLPAYPPDLGPPDRVFFQNLNGDVLVLVWLDPDDPSRVQLSLQIIEAGSFTIHKLEPRVLEQTSVNGQPAVWAEGPYMLQMRTGEMDAWRMVDGHVLIWVEAGVTHRLETDLSLAEAIRVAESLTP